MQNWKPKETKIYKYNETNFILKTKYDFDDKFLCVNFTV